MFASIRKYLKGAFVALITMSVVACAFLSPTVADARGGGFSGGDRSFSSARAYSAPRVVVAPRAVLVAPRVIIAPRPVVVVRPSFYPRPWYRPVIVPFVQPQQVVEADGSAQPEIVQVERHSGLSLLYVVFLVLLVLVVIGGGSYYGYSYIGGMTPFDVDAIICADMAYEAFYDGDYL